MEVQKQCVGIDISNLDFTVSICSQLSNQDLIYSETTKFSNCKKGFNQLNRWVSKHVDKQKPIVYLMEATGVYYEQLAHHLFKIKKTVHVVLPNKSKHYFSSLNVKSKTDDIDAKALSRFGVERKHRLWFPPSDNLLHLRHLTRYYVQLQEQKTSLNNIKHSKEKSVGVQKFILNSNKSLIKQLDKQILKCKKEVELLIQSDEELKQKVEKIATIKGLGILTIATIISETLGFEQFENVKQVVSYAGYDVVQRESGTSIKGKTKISKKGNKYIRNALYFPAMVACRYNEDLKSDYIRIIQKKPSKMIGQVAIQRKLLVLVYTLWKKDEEFIDGYKTKVASVKPRLHEITH